MRLHWAQVAGPRNQISKQSILHKDAHPSRFNFCPICRGRKRRDAKKCWQCTRSQTRPPDTRRVFTVDGEKCRKIACTKKQYAIVDAEDYDRVMKISWSAYKGARDHTYYANGHYRLKRGRDVTISMHRYVLGLKAFDGKIVDHKNRNGMDNRKSNLRICNKQQNGVNSKRFNKTGYRGVTKVSNGWSADISIHLGRYKTPQDAAMVWDQAATAVYGEFACLNFPKS